ncbi:Uncharacterised protein [Moraxella caviae]|uniref:Uncharacterized protein n=1 Tax=Moraxella caviae TaxID=34060 RepID=A0A378R8U5_9GAMM|nr:DUF3810 domain-containing protein [Moraxella caviae]STZ14537.1 Uncharacterised protein [Moraxella caviae]VEW12542.1 Uncharacterised protein [Moraxella caviae]
MSDFITVLTLFKEGKFTMGEILIIGAVLWVAVFIYKLPEIIRAIKGR